MTDLGNCSENEYYRYAALSLNKSRRDEGLLGWLPGMVTREPLYLVLYPEVPVMTSIRIRVHITVIQSRHKPDTGKQVGN